MTPGINIGDLHPDDTLWAIVAMRNLPGGERLNEVQCRHAINNSFTLCAYNGRVAVGFIRLVTDGATFSSVTDLFVEEDHRGEGIGTALLTEALGHHSISRTICVLQCRPALRNWYAARGFALCGDVMKCDPR